MDDILTFNEQLITEFRANGGNVGGQFANAPLLLLTTTGAKSGQPRTSPLVYTTDGDRLIIIASKGGAPTHPAWYHNLRTHPQVEVEVGTERFAATATEAEEPERTRLFNQMATQMPNFAEYQQHTPRVLPVIILQRTA